MFRMFKDFNALKITVQSVSQHSTYVPPYNPALLPVKKSHRKPRWIPVAKSKRFKVPERRKHPELEEREYLRLYNNYRNNVRSIRHYLIKRYCVTNQASLNPEEILKQFKEDLIKCHEINDKWNEEVKISREQRLNEELENALEAARKRVENQLLLQEEANLLAEEVVKKEKEASVSFITPENIDEAIDKALNEITDYNFAIELSGEKIIGKESKKEEKVSASQ